jgi:hypothetical protein
LLKEDRKIIKWASKNGRDFSGTNALYQGFSNCGNRATSGTPATVQWYTDIVRKTNRRIKKSSINAVT